MDAAAADGSPVLYWALGELDVAGVAREDLADCLLMRQVAHLEDALQASRAISRAEKRLVRCRLIIDLRGLRVLALLRRLGVVKRITAVGKTYFPEVTASATVWKPTSELGYPENYCGDLREPPRHRADAVTST